MFDESFTLVYDAIVSRDGATAALPTAVATGVAVAEPVSAAVAPVEEEPDAEILQDYLAQGANLGAGFAKWSPDTGESVHDRLATIVGSAMGYEAEDLPWEVPLIELGLDSLMAVRIKNRVEYDFDLPPIQLTAVRDANLYNVEKLIEYAIEHRDEVEQLHEHQQTLTPEEIAAEQAAMMAGTAPTVVTEPETPAASDIPMPPPPTNPKGPSLPPSDVAAGAAPAVNGVFEVKSIDSNNKIVAGPDGNVWFTQTGAGSNVAVGPFLLGINAPVNILTSSSTVRRIINMAALTVIEAHRAQ